MSATLEAPSVADALDEEGRLMTLEEFDALPENDGMDRWLIRGYLYECPMTVRGYSPCSIEANIVYHLNHWIKQQPSPRGRVMSGEAGFLLRRVPGSKVGIDVAYITAEQVAATAKDAKAVEGPPLLAVEVLSPSDRQREIMGKIDEYLRVGVSLIWSVEPMHRTITVYRPDAAPVIFTIHDDITAEPHLSGFRVAVAEIFE